MGGSWYQPFFWYLHFYFSNSLFLHYFQLDDFPIIANATREIECEELNKVVEELDAKFLSGKNENKETQQQEWTEVLKWNIIKVQNKKD